MTERNVNDRLHPALRDRGWPQVFLSKDRDGALSEVAALFYERLHWHESVLAMPNEDGDEFADGYDSATRTEIRWLRNVLDIIERS